MGADGRSSAEWKPMTLPWPECRVGDAPPVRTSVATARPAGPHDNPTDVAPGGAGLEAARRGNRRPASCLRPDTQRLWNPASGQFATALLRAAIVSRGWTVGEFAATAGIGRASVYRALGGRAVSDRTVIRIVAALELRSPCGLIDA
jgi:hypothetical protein